MDFPLRYTHRVTGKVYQARVIIQGQIQLLDPDTGEKITQSAYTVRKHHKSSKGNIRAASRSATSRPKMYSKNDLTSEFRKYLDGDRV
jgi:hypothetical protein